MKVPVYSLKLVRQRSFECLPISLKHPQIAALFFHKLIGQAASEHAAALFLDVKGQPLGSTIIAVGSLSKVPMVGREAFKAAIVANAASLIISHNHPSGCSTPSPADIRVTQELVAAGEVLGIRVLDHIIVTPSGTFASMLERGLLTNEKIDQLAI